MKAHEGRNRPGQIAACHNLMIHYPFVEEHTVSAGGQVFLDKIVWIYHPDITVEEEEPLVGGLGHKMRHDAVPLEHELKT